MLVLQANLDRGAVLVPGEYLDMLSAVQHRRNKWYVQQPWAACLPLCLIHCISTPVLRAQMVTYSTCRRLTCPWPVRRRGRLCKVSARDLLPDAWLRIGETLDGAVQLRADATHTEVGATHIFLSLK